MGDLATALMAAQFGREALASPGVAVAAAKMLATGNLKIEPAANVTTYEAQGVLVDVGTVEGEEWATGTLTGPADFNELVYYLDIFLKEMSGAQIDTSGAYKYICAPSATQNTPRRSWTVEYGDAAQASVNYRSANMVLDAFTVKGTRKSVEIDGKLIGQSFAKGVTMTASPTRIAKKSVLPRKVDLYLSTVSQADLDSATALTRGFSWEVSIGDRNKPMWPVASQYSSFAALLPNKTKAGAKLSVGAGGVASTSDTILAALQNGDRLWMRVLATGAQIGLDTLSQPVLYTMQIDTALEVANIGKPGDQDGAYAWDWEFIQVPDSAWSNKHIEYTIINALTTL